MSSRVFTSPGDVIRKVAGVLRWGRVLGDVYLRERLTPRERKNIMIAVSRINACQGCTYVHERWALRAGATDEELRDLEIGDLSGLDARGRAAVAYATARAEAGFRGTQSADADAASESLTPHEIAAVEAVARAMTLANLIVNTTESAVAGIHRRSHA